MINIGLPPVFREIAEKDPIGQRAFSHFQKLWDALNEKGIEESQIHAMKLKQLWQEAKNGRQRFVFALCTHLCMEAAELAKIRREELPDHRESLESLRNTLDDLAHQGHDDLRYDKKWRTDSIQIALEKIPYANQTLHFIRERSLASIEEIVDYFRVNLDGEQSSDPDRQRQRERAVANNHLARLVRLELVERVGQGIYCLSPLGETFLEEKGV